MYHKNYFIMLYFSFLLFFVHIVMSDPGIKLPNIVDEAVEEFKEVTKAIVNNKKALLNETNELFEFKSQLIQGTISALLNLFKFHEEAGTHSIPTFPPKGNNSIEIDNNVTGSLEEWCRSLRTPGNILVANLALSDLLMLAKTPVFVFNSFNLGPALGQTGCVLYGFMGGLTGTTSIATLTAIAMDRYWAVVRPLEPLRALTAIRARLLAVGSWLYACGFALIPALDIGYGRYVPEGYLTSCSFDYLTEEMSARYFIFIFFCAAWVAPFCTISFCYSKILRIVVFQRNIMTKNDEEKMSSRHVKEQVKRKAEIKLAGLVIIVIALFFLSWTPYAIVALLGIFGKKELITPTISMIPALFCKTAACINPFIYIITHPKFRKELQKLLFADKTKRMNSTFRTKALNESSKVHKPCNDLSDTDVEVIEMKDIPYRGNDSSKKNNNVVGTISSRVSGREGSLRSVSMKSFEDNVVSPPSWYAQPQFTKKKSFTRQSSLI